MRRLLALADVPADLSAPDVSLGFCTAVESERTTGIEKVAAARHGTRKNRVHFEERVFLRVFKPFPGYAALVGVSFSRYFLPARCPI